MGAENEAPLTGAVRATDSEPASIGAGASTAREDPGVIRERANPDAEAMGVSSQACTSP